MSNLEDPISPAEATAIEFFSVYQANVSAGFSKRQSIYLLAVQMVNSPGPAPDENEPPPVQSR